MNFNDKELSECLSSIVRLSGHLNRLAADGREFELFNALDHLEDVSRKAKWRMNNLRDKTHQGR